MHLIVTMTRCKKYCYHPTFCIFVQGGYTFIDDLPWISTGTNQLEAKETMEPEHGSVGIIPQSRKQ